MNILLSDWNTPFEIPPFDQIKVTDFAEAFEKAFAEGRVNSAKIAANVFPATFENTIEALERSDKLLDRVASVFFNIAGADSNPEFEALQRDLSPKLAAYSSELLMNDALFARVAAISDRGLNDEQKRVLKLYRRMFIRAGAALQPDAKTRLADIMAALASCGTAFTQNLLADERTWFMELDADGLTGLPDDLVSAAAAAAQDRDIDGHIITTSRSLIVPFLQFSPLRELREQAYEAWVARGANGGDTDNRGLANEMLALRYERANLLGFADFAAFKLDGEMAKNQQNVRDLLEKVWAPAKLAAGKDAEKLTELLHEDGINGDLAPWDWRYYAAILQQREHDLDDAEVKPYLELDRMINAAFDVAAKLFGLSFKPIETPLYHTDARAWEVLRGDKHIGVFIGDYFARPSKRSGAWCSRFRGQSKMDNDVRPIAVNVCNFSKPAAGAPALLGFDDVRTLFHEFGHALHSLMSDVTYGFISGTSVARDFVELPSQLFEHWGAHPQILRQHALHVETNEPMPEILLDRLKAAENFSSAFETVEFIGSAMVDLDFHSGEAPQDAMKAQAETLQNLEMPAAIRMRHATPNFAHVFAGDGYSSGYYSYMWSEVMDADAFEAFIEAGDIFDPETAMKLAKHIYSAGGSKDPEELYRAFRGALPNADALLKGRGLA